MQKFFGKTDIAAEIHIQSRHTVKTDDQRDRVGLEKVSDLIGKRLSTPVIGPATSWDNAYIKSVGLRAFPVHGIDPNPHAGQLTGLGDTQHVTLQAAMCKILK